MKTTPDFVEFVRDQLDALHGLRSARLFGGVGFKADGVQFAIVIDNVLYFAVDDTTRPAYEAMGSHCFAYSTRVRRVEVRRYYALPADLLEDRERLLALARESVAIAFKPRKRSRP
ncbi:TfoX/Sxy family protein [Variovorax sp. J22P168]|uniref:TfoX/Sxy family protein n=1 Tax=Variovorax jilinensis TaxID=3053513 RepID=UPI002575337E|nr:TfoX/Sxy family protein [Variovorax sp. J22P168]MDM0012600.1 TfoX/Sxy family protein [Variovorax sp. J22P168]